MLFDHWQLPVYSHSAIIVILGVREHGQRERHVRVTIVTEVAEYLCLQYNSSVH